MTTEKTVPQHLAIILDGNRRWAKSRGLPTLLGHRKGYKTFRTITEEAFNEGVKYISAFIFSTENWSRSKEEVDYLMDLALELFEKDLQEVHDQGIQIRWFGVKDHLSERHLQAINEAEELTRHNKKRILCLCFNYGGRREIADAVKSIVDEGVASDDVTEELIEKHLYHADIPPVDLMIRTSNEQRISNFLLWRLAYAELIFVKKHWPAFNKKDLHKVFEDYASRNRRFGS